MAKSSKSRPKGKSKKPYPEFPLTAHPSGQWCKKRKGKQFYFGPIADWQSAFERYKREWPYIITGRKVPATDSTGVTVRELANRFLTAKQNRVNGGELSPHSFATYYEACELLTGHFGMDRCVGDLSPDDFEGFRNSLARDCGIVTLKSKINRCRVVLNYAFDNKMVEKPVAFGRSFDRPSEKVLRKARNEAGPRMFEADEIRQIIDAAANPVLQAMILLGINCGFGNSDVANLPQSAIDFENGWCEFPRPKTEVRRRVPLWPETIAALQEAIDLRPEPIDEADKGLCFVTLRGNRFVRVQKSKTTPGRYVTINAVARRFDPILGKLNINGRGLGFYTLRHAFATIAGESRDQVAVNSVMGHVDTSMAATYRERISDERLRAVVDVVRTWLWPDKK